jgi:predicted DNA-binding transcriptional regulator YafY
MENLNRFDRIIAIFIHLQSGQVIKAQSLADRFQVSLRTIYRDIRSLEISGVPISGEPGFGYSIMDGYRLPPVMFSVEEAGSFVAAEKLMQKFSDQKLAQFHAAAIYKVKSVLRGNARDRMASLESHIWINTGQQLFNEHVPDALEIFLESMAEKKQVSLQYQSSDTEQISNRIIEPVALFNENNFWYIIGYCHLRNDYRNFRTDRITLINRTDKEFTRDHKDVENNQQPHATTEKTEVVIRVDKKVMKYLNSSRKYYGFISEKVTGNKVEMIFMTNTECDALARWYMMFSDHAEIIKPENFRQKVMRIIEQASININKTHVAINPQALHTQILPVANF